MKSRSLRIYAAVIALCLFIVFFVGRTYDPSTGKSGFTISSNGLSSFKKGMDIAGGVRLMYKIDLSKYKEIYPNATEYAEVTKNIKNIILQNIDGRISKLGVSDYNSYVQSLSDGDYIVVEIGGVNDLDEAKQIIGKTVELEFKLQYEWDGSDVLATRQSLAEDLLRQSSANPTIFSGLAGNRSSDSVFYVEHVHATLEQLPLIYKTNPQVLDPRNVGKIYGTLLSGVYEEITVAPTAVEDPTAPQQPTTAEGRTISKINAITTGTTTVSGEQKIVTYYDIEDIYVAFKPQWIVAKDPVTKEVLNGAFFKYANVSQSELGQPVAVINFDDKGKNIFCNLTQSIVGKPLAIFVDGKLVTAPSIREKICGGSAQIDGQFDMDGAKLLVQGLNEWALPAPLLLAHEEKVAPTLWERASSSSVVIAIVWFIVIYAFMLYLYDLRKSTIAIITLLAFFIVLAAVIKIVGYALSLSGIAAVLLSIGMAVDANILIYERLKEERDAGKPMDKAIEEAYHRSWPAVRDGNLTAGLIWLLLFFMGTNMFKWFGTMMMVTIALTLVVIVPLTRHLLHEVMPSTADKTSK